MADQTNKVMIYGADWCPDCDRLKRHLIEWQIDFIYIDIDFDPAAAAEVVRLNHGQRVIPVVVAGAKHATNPSRRDLAATLGVEAGDGDEEKLYDVVIVGGGVAGLSSAIYTTRDRLKTLILEKAVCGGQILTTAAVENYPGFPEPLRGAELVDRLVTQVKRFGAEILERTAVTTIERRGDAFRLTCEFEDERREVLARALILACGSQYRMLGVPGEKELAGYGVSFCGTCDAPFYRGRHVVAVGGGNTAIDEGLHLLKFVDKLTVVQKAASLTAQPFLVEELLKQKEKVEILTRTVITRIEGTPETRVTGVVLKDLATGTERRYPCDGVFVWIGLTPNTAFLKGFVELDAEGFIVAEECSMQTSVPGVLAAGDGRSGSKKQLATASGDGVVAALVASEFLKKQKRDEARV